MLELKNKTIAEIVSNDISTASIFKKYDLDFCCGGEKTIDNACKNANINTTDVINDLLSNTPINSSAPNLNFKDWDTGFLIDYIINVHHNYIKDNLSIINEFATKVARVHGERSPETLEIDDLFTFLSNELLTHMEKEETLLFPDIQLKISNKNYLIDKRNIAMIKDEHTNTGIILKRIQELSNNFTAPKWACNTYKALYHKLEEFSNDLYQHIHLENNILFLKMKE